MKTYDSLIRVSKINGRIETADSTLTVDSNQGTADRHAVHDVGGRIGKTLKALDQSGFSVHESKAWQTGGPSRSVAVRATGSSSPTTTGSAATGARPGRSTTAMEQRPAMVPIFCGMPGVDYRTAEVRAMTGMLAVAADFWATTPPRRNRATSSPSRRLTTVLPDRVSYGSAQRGRRVKTDPAKHAKALVPDKHTAYRQADLQAARRRRVVDRDCGHAEHRRGRVAEREAVDGADAHVDRRQRGLPRGRGARRAPSRGRAQAAGHASAVAGGADHGHGHAQRADDHGARRGGVGLLGMRQADARRRLRHQRRLFYGCARRSPRAVPRAHERDKDAADAFVDQVMVDAIKGGRCSCSPPPASRDRPQRGRGRDGAPQGVASGAGHRPRRGVGRGVRAT